MLIRAITFAAFLLVLAMTPARAEELITAYDSDITINQDSSLTVEETITLNVEGIDIKRGIIRSYPTRYKLANGEAFTVGLTVENVTRDGNAEPYVVSEVGNGIEIKIGDKDVLLTHGPHTYVIAYRASSILGHFAATDELYYNVLGFDTPYVTQRAIATIRLPSGARPSRMDVWTGVARDMWAGAGGLKLENATITETEPGVVTIESISPLQKFEGIIVAIEWPIGFVTRPGKP